MPKARTLHPEAAWTARWPADESTLSLSPLMCVLCIETLMSAHYSIQGNVLTNHDHQPSMMSA